MRGKEMIIALITVVLLGVGAWLLYREPPKQRPAEALSRFDRMAQRVHELIQGRWYGKVAATVGLIVVGLLVSRAVLLQAADRIHADRHGDDAGLDIDPNRHGEVTPTQAGDLL